jgi:NAD(P)-dependent dehydrogenase (short-subunit alcohol dehydrogenase family)
VERLKGQVAIITGSTAGIGRATAILFAQEGAKVIVSGRRRELGEQVVQEIRAGGGEATFCRADVRHSDELRALVQCAVDHYGRLDILVNNAWSGKVGTVLEVEEQEWDDLFATTLKAAYLGSKFAIPEMIKVGGGSIINLSSVHGLLVARKWAPYDAAKAGIINLTRSLALDFGPQGIRVNAICPGLIVTEKDDPNSPGHSERMRLTQLVYPLGRPGRPKEVAQAAVFLASNEASFITGIALTVDGGLTIQLQDSLAEKVVQAFTRLGNA